MIDNVCRISRESHLDYILRKEGMIVMVIFAYENRNINILLKRILAKESKKCMFVYATIDLPNSTEKKYNFVFDKGIADVKSLPHVIFYYDKVPITTITKANTRNIINALNNFMEIFSAPEKMQLFLHHVNEHKKKIESAQNNVQNHEQNHEQHNNNMNNNTNNNVNNNTNNNIPNNNVSNNNASNGAQNNNVSNNTPNNNVSNNNDQNNNMQNSVDSQQANITMNLAREYQLESMESSAEVCELKMYERIEELESQEHGSDSDEGSDIKTNKSDRFKPKNPDRKNKETTKKASK